MDLLWQQYHPAAAPEKTKEVTESGSFSQTVLEFVEEILVTLHCNI